MLPEYFLRMISGYAHAHVKKEIQDAIFDELKSKLSSIGCQGRIFIGLDGINIQISAPASRALEAKSVLVGIYDGFFPQIRVRN